MCTMLLRQIFESAEFFSGFSGSYRIPYFRPCVRPSVRPDFYDGITFEKMIFFQKFFLLYTFEGMLISNEAFRESSSTPS